MHGDRGLINAQIILDKFHTSTYFHTVTVKILPPYTMCARGRRSATPDTAAAPPPAGIQEGPAVFIPTMGSGQGFGAATRDSSQAPLPAGFQEGTAARDSGQGQQQGQDPTLDTVAAPTSQQGSGVLPFGQGPGTAVALQEGGLGLDTAARDSGQGQQQGQDLTLGTAAAPTSQQDRSSGMDTDAPLASSAAAVREQQGQGGADTPWLGEVAAGVGQQGQGGTEARMLRGPVVGGGQQGRLSVSMGTALPGGTAAAEGGGQHEEPDMMESDSPNARPQVSLQVWGVILGLGFRV